MNVDFSLSPEETVLLLLPECFFVSAVEAMWTIAVYVMSNVGLENIMKIERNKRRLIPFLRSFILGQHSTWLAKVTHGCITITQEHAAFNKQSP